MAAAGLNQTAVNIESQGVRGGRPKTDDADPQMRGRYARMRLEVSVAELVALAAEKGVDPGDMTVSWPTAHWRSLESPEEVAERLDFKRRQRERVEAWERETYDRLRDKFEGTAK